MSSMVVKQKEFYTCWKLENNGFFYFKCVRHFANEHLYNIMGYVNSVRQHFVCFILFLEQITSYTNAVHLEWMQGIAQKVKNDNTLKRIKKFAWNFKAINWMATRMWIFYAVRFTLLMRFKPLFRNNFSNTVIPWWSSLSSWWMNSKFAPKN